MRNSTTFDAPGDVLRFVKACLDDRALDRLYNAAMEPTPDFWRERIFEDLCQIEASETLEGVFLIDDWFPEDEDEYKLGGHSKRTRHLHLDLVRDKDGWRLKKIWKCR